MGEIIKFDDIKSNNNKDKYEYIRILFKTLGFRLKTNNDNIIIVDDAHNEDMNTTTTYGVTEATSENHSLSFSCCQKTDNEDSSIILSNLRLKNKKDSLIINYIPKSENGPRLYIYRTSFNESGKESLTITICENGEFAISQNGETLLNYNNNDNESNDNKLNVSPARLQKILNDETVNGIISYYCMTHMGMFMALSAVLNTLETYGNIEIFEHRSPHKK